MDKHLEYKPPRDEYYDFARRLHHETMKPLCVAFFEWNDGEQDIRFGKNWQPSEVSIIFQGSAKLGWIQLQVTENNLNLGSLYLSETFRGQGYGASIIRDIMKKASGHPLTLGVLKNNKAFGLYTRLGFVIKDENEYKYFMEYMPS